MRYKCIVSYDGSLFHGFQTQKNLRTVQEEIESTLKLITKKKTLIFASSRTDTGVHALGQVFHFDSDIDTTPWNMKNAINSRLPKDIHIISVEKVTEDFNARFNVIKKEYHYIINLNEYNPLRRNYEYYIPYKKIDVNLMKEASKIFIGEHDFKSFTKNHIIENTVRTIYSIDISCNDNLIVFKICGNGFLHNMVRIIVAMLVEVSKGKITISDLQKILDLKDRKYAPKIAPANGLYLYKIYYE